MSSTNFLHNLMVNMEAGAAVAVGQVVKLSSGKVVPCSTAGETFFGVCQDDGAIGEKVRVVIQGEALIQTADTTAVGGFVKTNADGRAVAAGAAGTVVGMLLETGYAVASGKSALRSIAVRCTNLTLA